MRFKRFLVVGEGVGTVGFRVKKNLLGRLEGHEGSNAALHSKFIFSVGKIEYNDNVTLASDRIR